MTTPISAASWNDKVVLVTGGSAGLGLAIATAFAAAGANLAIAARNPETLATAAQSLATHGRPVLQIAADVTQQADVEAMIAQTIARFGRLDVLVNNAGRSTRGLAIDTTPEAFQLSLDLNFLALVRCTRAAMPHLLARQGHLVNIGSLAAKTASPFVGAYPASKFAVAAYTQQLRLEMTAQGLHTLLVCPGPIADTTRSESRYASQAADLPESAKKPGGGVKVRVLQPDLVAHAIVVACQRRRPELVFPPKARLLFAIAQLSPSWGDWLLKRYF